MKRTTGQGYIDVEVLSKRTLQPFKVLGNTQKERKELRLGSHERQIESHAIGPDVEVGLELGDFAGQVCNITVWDAPIGTKSRRLLQCTWRGDTNFISIGASLYRPVGIIKVHVRVNGKTYRFWIRYHTIRFRTGHTE